MVVSKVTSLRGGVPCASFGQPSPRLRDQMQALLLLLLKSARIWWLPSIPAEVVTYEAGC